MKKTYLDNMQKAYNAYNINNDGDLPEKILKYLCERIEANRDEIEKVISIYELDVKIDEIIKIIKDEENKEIESIGKTIINNGFMFAQIMVPEGLIAVRTYDTIEIIKYWIYAIKYRNAIMVASYNYNEYSLEALVLIIIKEALNKFNLDENLVMYIKEDECEYELFDIIIYTCDENKKFDKSEIHNMAKSNSNKNKKYVYIESEEFRDEAEKNKDVEILTGDIDEIVEKVKNSRAVVIYTKDSQKAYKFINLVRADNVFVNANLENEYSVMNSENELYKYRNIIIPIPKDLINKRESKENQEADETNDIEKNNMMIEYKESLWQKIINRFKNLFK